MFAWIRHLLIPHHGNSHRPHILRTPIIRGLLALVVVLELFFLAEVYLAPAGNFLASVVSSVMIAETNAHRASDALASLSVNPLLEEAAKRKAEDMAEKGYFSHVGPEGEQPWVWLKGVGYYYLAAGENLAVNFVDSKDVTDAWMNSPAHRANILNGMFTEIGIGTAQGTYKGKETTFIVQFFGRPYEPVAHFADAGVPGDATDAAPSPAPLPVPTPVSPLPPEPQDDGPSEVADSQAPALPIEEAPKQPSPVTVANELFTQTPAAPATGTVQVLGSDIAAYPSAIASGEPTMLGFLMTNPRKTSAMALFAVAFLVALALVLTVYRYVHTKHADLLANGLVILAVVLCIVLANDYLSASRLLIL